MTAAGPFPPPDTVNGGESLREALCAGVTRPLPSPSLCPLTPAPGTPPSLSCPLSSHLLRVCRLPHTLFDQVQTPRYLCAQWRGDTQFIQGEGGRHMGGQPPTVNVE